VLNPRNLAEFHNYFLYKFRNSKGVILDWPGIFKYCKNGFNTFLRENLLPIHK
jgi:hypothetical protein